MNELSTLSDTELLRYVDRSHPQVAELARRLELLHAVATSDDGDVRERLREVAGL